MSCLDDTRRGPTPCGLGLRRSRAGRTGLAWTPRLVRGAGAMHEDANHMATVHHDSLSSDEARRWAAYEGDIFLTSPDAATARFCHFNRELIEEAFAGVDPNALAFHPSYFDRVVPKLVEHVQLLRVERQAPRRGVLQRRDHRPSGVRDAGLAVSSSSRVTICTRACPTTAAGRGFDRLPHRPHHRSRSRALRAQRRSLLHRFVDTGLHTGIRSGPDAGRDRSFCLMTAPRTEGTFSTSRTVVTSLRSRPTKTPDSNRSHAPQAVRLGPTP